MFCPVLILVIVEGEIQFNTFHFMHNVRYYLNTLVLKNGLHWRVRSVKGMSPVTYEKIKGRPMVFKILV
jgi:hypothetical protein